MLGNGVEMSFINRQILGPLNFSWAPNHLVLGAQLAPSEIRLVCFLHLQYMNNHYAKFEMKTVGATDYTNQTPSKHLDQEKCVSLRPTKIKKIFMKCAQNKECTSSMCEPSLCKV